MANLLRNFNKVYSSKVVTARLFSRNTPRFCDKMGDTHCMYRPTNAERRILVWAGKYKSMGEVPESVPADMVASVRNKFRIRVSNYMIVFTCFLCLIMIISGKKQSERGHTVAHVNQEWHKRLNQDEPSNGNHSESK